MGRLLYSLAKRSVALPTFVNCPTPEGLHAVRVLDLQGHDIEFLILDAQDMPWVRVISEDRGDPPEWYEGIVQRVSFSLGIKETHIEIT